MSKKRTFDEAFCDPVTVPFKARVPAGHCTFTIEVPKIYEDRRFFFSSFFLMPDFYSTEAALEDLEDPEVQNTPIEYEIVLKQTFLSKPSLYPETFELDKAITKTQVLPQKVNDFFEAHKPSGCLHLGAFFDWIDTRFYLGSWDEYMKSMAKEFYNEPLDKAKHFNALPVSARSIFGVNNYLFPTNMSEETREFIRFRLWLAPNTDAYFSSDVHLLCMGFSEEQLGDRVYQRKILIENDNSVMGFSMFPAENPYDVTMSKEVIKHQFKMDLALNDNVFITYDYPIVIKKADSFKNKNYFDKLKEALAEIREFSNFMLDVAYNATTKKFKFSFARNPSLSKMTLLVPTDLAERLGFGLITGINENNAEGERVDDDDIDVTKTETKARALGYDTGMILVTNEAKTTNTLKGISEQLMCTVYPTATGVYEISGLESRFAPPTMHLPNFFSSAQGDVHVTFKLYRFLDSNQPATLDWKNGAFVCGQFRGIEPDQHL